MADYQAYFNGEWMPFGEVTISPSDRGFLGRRPRVRGREDVQWQTLPAERAHRAAVPLADLHSDGRRTERGGDDGHHRGGRRAGKGRSPRRDGLLDAADRDARHGRPFRPARSDGLGASRRTGLLVRRPVRHGIARSDFENAGILAAGPRPQDQALQPNELRPRAPRGERCGAWRVADTAGRPGLPCRGQRPERLRRDRRRNSHTDRLRRAAGSLAGEWPSTSRASSTSRSSRKTSSHTTSTPPTRRFGRRPACASCR